MFQKIIYTAIKTALANITASGISVQYLAGTFQHRNEGVYISAYSEREANTKIKYAADVDVTLTCFVRNSTIDRAIDIADRVEALMLPAINETINSRIVIQTKTARAQMGEIIDGQKTDRIELIYNFLIT